MGAFRCLPLFPNYVLKAASRSRVAKAINNNQNLIDAVLLWVIVFLALAVVMICFPNLGAIVAQYNQF
jgi:hypothetical protein